MSSRPSRFRALGARDAASVGDLKAAAASLAADPAELAALRRRIGDRPIWIAASTHPGEEEIAAAAHVRVAREHPRLLTIIAPRHPARGAAIAETLRQRGIENRPAQSRRDAVWRNRYLSGGHAWRSGADVSCRRDRLYRRLAGRERRTQPVRGGTARLRRLAWRRYEQLRRNGRCARSSRRGADGFRCREPWRSRGAPARRSRRAAGARDSGDAGRGCGIGHSRQGALPSCAVSRCARPMPRSMQRPPGVRAG